MKIYKLTPIESLGHDAYDCLIVCARNEGDAKKIIPEDTDNYNAECEWVEKESDIIIEYLGEAKTDLKEGIIFASFNEG